MDTAQTAMLPTETVQTHHHHAKVFGEHGSSKMAKLDISLIRKRTVAEIELPAV
jgi:hypothetical protein